MARFDQALTFLRVRAAPLPFCPRGFKHLRRLVHVSVEAA